MKKLICEDIFAQVEVIKAFMKTKVNGENIYKMLNAWLRNCRSILSFMKKKNKGYKDKDQKENICADVKQFLIVFL